MNDIQAIVPGHGLGDLRFGALRQEVTAYLGEPDGVEMCGEPGDTSEMWHYESIGGYVSFDEEDGFRLGTIETASDQASLSGHCLIGCPQEQVLKWLDELELGEWYEEEIEPEDEEDVMGSMIAFPEYGLNLWFEEGVLEAIQWEHLIDSDGHVVWPAETPADPQ